MFRFEKKIETTRQRFYAKALFKMFHLIESQTLYE